MQRRFFTQATAVALLPLGAHPVQATSGLPAVGAGALRERARQEGRGFVAAQVSAQGVQLTSAGQRSASDAAEPDAGADLFEIGSITKTFTALLLAQAVLRKDFALTDPVEPVLGLRLRDSQGQPLQWLDLATHRSGLPRLASNMQPRLAADPYADYGWTQLKAFLETWQPQVPRQARWEYSNLGFGLLGHALGLHAGKPFAALLHERVLQPLGLGDMRVAVPGDGPAGLLPGHDANGQAVPRWTFDTMAGGGALIGSARSLARYAQAALGLIDTPLAPAFELTLRRHADGSGPANPMGLGWTLGRLNGRRIANHDGGTYGFSSSLFLDLDQQRASLVLANAFVPVTDLALHLLEPSIAPRDVAAEKRKTQREAVSVPASQLAPLAGVYALNPRFKLTVSPREGRLFAQATGQGEFELFALQARRFFARVAALEVEFEGETGVAGALVLTQGGQRLRFVREP